MKFSRLFQPRSSLFWLMLIVNVLSFLLLFIARTRPLNTFGGFAQCNALLGSFLAWHLAHDGRTEAC